MYKLNILRMSPELSFPRILFQRPHAKSELARSSGSSEAFGAYFQSIFAVSKGLLRETKKSAPAVGLTPNVYVEAVH